jgi:hypothetical protein
MAQIFISHSQRDESIINFFLKAFAGTKVKPLFQEFEKEPPSGITAKEIEQNIEQSNAIFVLLSETVDTLKHTRDWVTWECGTARNKDIWVYEPFESFGKIRMIIPRINHYVRFQTSNAWRKYLRSIIESYDDSDVLLALSTAGATGAILNKQNRSEGTAAGLAVAIAGLSLHKWSKPSLGSRVQCHKCSANYKVHLADCRFRCPICNSDWMFIARQGIKDSRRT